MTVPPHPTPTAESMPLLCKQFVLSSWKLCRSGNEVAVEGISFRLSDRGLLSELGGAYSGNPLLQDAIREPI